MIVFVFILLWFVELTRSVGLKFISHLEKIQSLFHQLFLLSSSLSYLTFTFIDPKNF